MVGEALPLPPHSRMRVRPTRSSSPALWSLPAIVLLLPLVNTAQPKGETRRTRAESQAAMSAP